MKEETILKAATHFGTGVPSITPLGNGLIHRTSKVTYNGGQPALVLQCLNQRTFPLPENIIQNYLLIYRHLEKEPGAIQVPALVPTHQHAYFWIDEEENFWRANRYVEGSYTVSVPGKASDAYEAARCYAAFTRSLAAFDVNSLYMVIPDFHNLDARFQLFEEAIRKAGIMRLLRATHVISGLRERRNLLTFYQQLQHDPDYPVRALHHDCKISNILFDQETKAVVCPVDLDTVMPGKFISDVGDMIRTMACTENENSTSWENIGVNRSFYQAVIAGYLNGMNNTLTQKEQAGIHYSGLIMTCMQALRFVTDYLNNDVYYRTDYPEQNLNRALNQFILLEQLEILLKEEYAFSIN